MTDVGRIPAHQLAGRALRRRPHQTLLVVVVGTLIAGAVVFAAGFQRLAQQVIIDATFAADGPTNSWHLTGAAPIDLPALLPSGTDAWFVQPISGREVVASWSSTGTSLAISGTMVWRDDACAHLVLVRGRCPAAGDEVAVSADDSAVYRARVGSRLTIGASSDAPREVTVTGIYRPRDAAEAYWFGTPPTGRSGFDIDGTPHADPLFTVRESVTGSRVQEILDLRLDKPEIRLPDLAALDLATTTLAASATQHQARLTTSIPVSLDYIATERARVVSGLVLMFAQLSVLAAVVIALLIGVTLAGQRAELGLRRLRGEPAGALRREVLSRWALTIGAGWLLGWGIGLALLALVADQLPGDRPLAASPALVIAPFFALGLVVAAMLPASRQLLAQPVVDLLRTAPPSAGDSGRADVLIDVVVVVLGLGGVVVALQVGTSSAVGMLVPALSALGLGVLLVRALRAAAATGRRRWSRRGVAPAALLAAVLSLRLRGMRIMVVTLCLATAVAVFAVQLLIIGTSARRHIAEVTTGAAAVLVVRADPVVVVRALAEIDPAREAGGGSSTVVVVTRRADAAALRAMYVEPDPFRRIALGARQLTDDAGWRAITAPALPPIVVRGDALTVSVGEHAALGVDEPGDGSGRSASVAELGLDLLTAQGRLLPVRMGSIEVAAGPGQRLRRPVDCDPGCRLLRITLTPDGPVRGTLPVTGLVVAQDGAGETLRLGEGIDWQSLPVRTPGTGAELSTEGATAGLVVRTGGTAVGVQHDWLPAEVPALLSADVVPGGAETVATPAGTPLPIRAVARAHDAVPRELTDVAVADLNATLRGGTGRLGPRTSVQVWLSDPAQVARLTSALQGHGIGVVAVHELETALDHQRTTASALTAGVVPGLVVLTGILGALAVALTMAGQRAGLRRDLGGLAVAGVGSPTAARAITLSYLLPALLAVVTGAVAGAFGCALVVGDLPLVPDASPAIAVDRGLRLGPLAVTVGGAAVVAVLVVLLGVRRVLAGDAADQLRAWR